jgi:two-component system sensor histidine kinase GlrK
LHDADLTIAIASVPSPVPTPLARLRTGGLRGLSFHQCLLAAFLLITALLGGAAVQAMFALDHVASQGRQASQDAAGLTAQVQRLAERTVAMERSARQFLVLDDPGLRDRYQAAWQDAQATQAELAPLLAGDASARQALADWGAQAEAAWAVLQAPARARGQALRKLAPAFARLHALNEALGAQSQQAMDRRSDAVLAELEQQWRLISALVLGAIALAVLLGFGFGHWLLRPLVHLEAAIGRLGDNRFDQPVQVRGPADLRRLGGQLEWLRQRLAALESDKTRFVRHISHELKTPMASIREGTALLRDGVAGPLTPDQAEIVRILGDNTAALQRQIEDLLRYQALASDAQQLQRRPTDLAALLARVVEDQRLLWQAKGLTVQVDARPCTASVDAEKLTAVLANLLVNAVRFSPPGGAIRLALAFERARVCIDCIDAGPGVAAEDVQRVFDPFYQGRNQPAGARRGNGIGLSIVREIVQAHGGTCRLLPSDRGAHFRIEIPHVP